MEIMLISRNNPDQTIQIKACPFIIGSGSGCDYCLSEQGVSNPHACIAEGNGHFYVVDLKSRNGTHVIHPRAGQSPAMTNAPIVEKSADIAAQHLIPGAELVDGAIVAFAGSLFACSIKSSLVFDGSSKSRTDTLVEPATLNVSITHPRITVTKGIEAGRVIDLTSFPVVLGSSQKQADIVFQTVKCVSRIHARLSRQDDGGIILEDLQSRNGTFVNNQQVTQPIKLNDGDKISLAREVDFSFRVASKISAQSVLKKQKSPVRSVLVMVLAVIAGIAMVAAAIWFKGRAPNPVQDPESVPLALTNTPPQEVVPKPPETSPVIAVKETPGAVENVANIDKAERLLASVNGWVCEELQLAQQKLSGIPDSDSYGPRKAVCLTAINARLDSIHQLDAACDQVEKGDYQEAVSLIDKSLGFASHNDDAVYAKDGMKRLIELRDFIAVATNAAIDYRELGARIAAANNSFSGDAKLPSLFRRQVETLSSPLMVAVVADIQALIKQGKYLDGLERIHDGLTLLPGNKDCKAALVRIEPEARKVLDNLITQAYWMENDRSSQNQEKAQTIYHAIAHATSVDDWTRDFHKIAVERSKR